MTKNEQFYSPFYDQSLIGWVFLIPPEHAAKLSRKELTKSNGSVLIGPFTTRELAERRANVTHDAMMGKKYAASQ